MIIANLRDRIEEARMNDWMGEVQGLQVSLDEASRKLVVLDRTRDRRVPNTAAAVCDVAACRGYEDGHRVIDFKVCWISKRTR
ncbi:hypothetical protein, partial [Amycolatopsis speibonae]